MAHYNYRARLEGANYLFAAREELHLAAVELTNNASCSSEYLERRLAEAQRLLDSARRELQDGQAL